MTSLRFAGARREIVAPSQTDPLARDVSGAWSGPRGRHSWGGPRWWNPLVVIMLMASVTFAVGVVQKLPCVKADFGETNFPFTFTHLCYSDIQYLYTGRDLARGTFPFTPVDRTAVERELRTSGQLNGLDSQQVDDLVTSKVNTRTVEYPVLTGIYMGVMGLLTHFVGIGADLSDISYDQEQGDKLAQHDSAVFWNLNVVGFFVVFLIALVLLVKAQPRRPWDALMVAASPVIALDAMINWDLLAIGFVAAVIWAWSTKRPLATGLFLGLGTATKLYPLFLLGPLVVLCLRERQTLAAVKVVATAVVTWTVVNLPIYLWSPHAWSWFWSFNRGRAGEFGSIWYLLVLNKTPVSANTINLVTLIGFAICCLAIAALAIGAPRRPRLVSLMFLVVASFLLINKVYSPQYALWLLPLAALARPRWRDLLIWQACEAIYFVAIWIEIGSSGIKADKNSPAIDFTGWYTLATLIRIAGTVYLIAIVVRDILRPWLDPVRGDGLTDDPLGGILDEGLDVELDEWADEQDWSPEPTGTHRAPE
jgi:uncharacterized membrane protein